MFVIKIFGSDSIGTNTRQNWSEYKIQCKLQNAMLLPCQILGCQIFLYTVPDLTLRCRGIPLNFRLSNIGSKIRHIQWTILGDILCILLFAKGGPPILRNKKKHSVRKVGNKSCSTFPLNLGIYYLRACWLQIYFTNIGKFSNLRKSRFPKILKIG